MSEKKQLISENALNAWETLSLGASIPQNGKIKVFLVNDTEQEAYFDELEIVISNKPTTKIVQENNYYPFGLNMRGLEKVGSPDDKFQYNAQTEKDEDIEMYETPFRGYQADIGIFRQVDLLAPLFPSITPFHFGYNNPVYFNDPSGLLAQTEQPSSGSGGSSDEMEAELKKKQSSSSSNNSTTSSNFMSQEAGVRGNGGVKPNSQQEFNLVKGTLPQQDANRLSLNEKGYIQIEGNEAGSEELEYLRTIIMSGKTIHLKISDTYSFKNRENKVIRNKKFDASTYGITLVPNGQKFYSGGQDHYEGSADKDIHVIINSNAKSTLTTIFYPPNAPSNSFTVSNPVAISTITTGHEMYLHVLFYLVFSKKGRLDNYNHATENTKIGGGYFETMIEVKVALNLGVITNASIKKLAKQYIKSVYSEWNSTWKPLTR